MTIERKYIDLKDLKVSDEGPGTIEGYRSVFHEIDEGGDLIVKGFFADSIPEYLEAGFSAHSHDWNFKEAVGFPIEAKEDDHGFYVKSQFHSTGDAQDIRKKAQERMAAGKKVGFSFGYSVSDKSFIEAKDYKDQLPLFVRPERLQANLQKAQKFDRIRILKKGEVIEDSIVTAPMNKLAMASAVKSNDEETKTIRKCKPEDTEPGKPWCLYSSDGGKLLGRHATREECVAQEQAVEANKSLTTEQIQQLLESADDAFYLKVIAASESFESFDKAAPAALKKFIENMQRNHEARIKEGRVLSTSNRATVQKCKDSLTALMGDLDALLAMSEPKPKEKEIDVESLRTQSLRMQSLAVRALA